MANSSNDTLSALFTNFLGMLVLWGVILGATACAVIGGIIWAIVHFSS